MPNYKVSGTTYEICNIKLIRNNEILGYLDDVPEGPYEAVVELASALGVTVVAENSDGKVRGYGNVTPILTADPVNLSSPAATPVYTKLASHNISVASGTIEGTLSLGYSYDRTRTIIIYGGLKTSYTYVDGMPHLNWGSDSVMKATRITTRNFISTVGFALIEYSPGIIKSIQTGYSATSGLITINSVDINKSIVIGIGGYGANLELYSSTQINILESQASWQVVEFN